MKKIKYSGYHIIQTILLGIFLILLSLPGTSTAKVDLESFEEKLSKEITEIRGTPKVRIVSSQKETFKVELKEKDQNDSAPVILREGNDYIWASREGKPLVHRQSGAFDFFI